MTMNWPRILVGITTYDKKHYMLPRCYDAVRNFDYPADKYDVLVVDNTNDNGRYYRKLKKMGLHKVEHTSRGKNSREALTKSQNLIRKRVLEGDYDYLLFVESDLLPEKDQLKRLLSFGKKVVGSTYIIGTGEVKVPCIFLSDVKIGGFKGTRPLGIKRNEAGQNVATDYDEVNAFLNTGLRRVHGCGFGCTLIHRTVLERTVFWCDERFDNKHSDVYFYLDMERMEEPVFVDTDRIVPHFPTDWALVEDR